MPTNYQSSLVLNQYFQAYGVFPQNGGPESGASTVGMVHTLAAVNFEVSVNFLPADGRLLPLPQNTASFSLLGTTYGGNGTTNFALPNLVGRTAVYSGQGPGLSNHPLGQSFGSANFTPLPNNLPTTSGGTSVPLDNYEPSLALTFYINTTGFLPQPGVGTANYNTLGFIFEAAQNFPDGIPCDGRLLPIASNTNLFQILGTTYGGDGITTFAIPDLRGRTIIGSGNGHTVGEVIGTPTDTLTNANLATNMGGGGQAVNNQQPGLVLNTLVALTGTFHAGDDLVADLGEIFYFAGNFVPGGYALAQGQSLTISSNLALFALVGTTYGGDGVTNFNLPNLAGRAIVGAGAGFTPGTVLGSDTATFTSADIPSLSFSGTPAADRLLSGDGNDTIGGLLGNDTIISTAGVDTLSGNEGNDILIAGEGNDFLYGGSENDILIGQNGNDTLDGGTGNNELYGGLGNDTYIIASVGDSVIESVGEGIDEERTALSVLTLAPNVENLTYTGTVSFLGLGNASDNVITGGVGRDSLYGRDGNDTLSDGGGSVGQEDTMLGGAGNDIYIVNVRGDSTVEFAGEGVDEVRTTFSVYGLQANIENLTFTDIATHGAGVGNILDNVLTGGIGADDLFGREGNDTLVGGLGSANTLLGQEGDDIYIVSAVGDSVIEFAGQGNDTVRTGLSSFTLTANVENLVYTGVGAITGIGSADGNSITGGAFADFLSGLDGNDVLIGGSGADTLLGGNGADQFRYAGGETGLDRILDFTSGSDTIALSATGFVHTATVDFISNGAPAPTSTNSTFLYNVNNGIVSYDADGTGSGAAVQIAQLNAGLTLAAGDFIFY